MVVPATSARRSVHPAHSSKRREPHPVTFPIAEFEAIEYVGGGALAEVWHARDRDSDIECAVKILKTDWAEYPVARFLLENEAEVGLDVNSDYVVKVFDAELEHAPPYLVMQWLAGESLETTLERDSRLPYSEALWIARQCAQGLESLRHAGYTHGDVKPSNIMLSAQGSVKLLDLGFARRCRKHDQDLSRSTNLLTGTPQYLAPEALSSGWEGGVARDIYSLGVTMYRMLAGRLPFQEVATEELLRSQLGSTPPGVRKFASDVPRELEQLVSEMLAKQPIRRPQSLQRLIRRLVELELALFPTQAEAA